jgi:heat shock protein HslJ
MVGVKRLTSNWVLGLLGLAAVVALAACAPQAGLGPQIDPAPQIGPTPEALPDQPVPAALNAQQWLAERLGLRLEQVEILAFEPGEWSDSCLGWGLAHESCLQALTPGWLVTLKADGVEYEVRTDETGSVVRLPPPQADDPLAGTSWVLESIGAPGAETPALPGVRVTLSFDLAGQAGGEGGCNAFGGSYTAEGGRLTFGHLTQTLRLCADEAANQQEAAYLAALQAAQSFRVEGERLVVEYAGGEVRMKSEE